MTTRRWRRLVAAAIGFAAGNALFAQQPAGPPKPGAETKKLDVLAGKWKGEAETKAGPWGPGGKMTTESDCSWFQGDFQLVCTLTESGPLGEFKTQYALGWSAEEKAYKSMGFDSMGMMYSSTGTVSGNTWTWKSSYKTGGKVIHSRYTVVVTTPTSQMYKYETSPDGTIWATLAEGTSTKN